MDYNKFDGNLKNTLEKLQTGEVSIEYANVMVELAETTLQTIILQVKYEQGGFQKIDSFEPFFLSEIYLTDDLETMEYRFLHTQQIIQKIKDSIKEKQ